MSKIFIARVVSVQDLENGFEIKIKAATDFSNMNRVYIARPPSTAPVTNLGSGTLGRPDPGQLCIAYYSVELVEAQILTYLGNPGTPIVGELLQAPLESGSYRIQASGIAGSGIELFRSGRSVWWSSPEVQIEMLGEDPTLQVRARKLVQRTGLGGITEDTNVYTRWSGVREDYSSYIDLDQDSFKGSQNYPRAGMPTNLSNGVYRYTNKMVEHIGPLEGGHLYQRSIMYGDGTTPHKNLVLQEEVGLQPESELLWNRWIYRNTTDGVLKYQDRWTLGGFYKLIQHQDSSGYREPTLQKPLQDTLEVGNGYGFEEKYNEEGYNSFLWHQPKEWESTKLITHENALYTEKRSDWTFSHLVSGNVSDQIWNKMDGTAFQSVSTDSKFTLSYITKNESGPDKNRIEIEEKKIRIQTSSGEFILLDGNSKTIELRIPGQVVDQYITISPDGISLQAAKDVKLDMKANGMTFNGTPVLLKPLLDMLEQNKDFIGLGVPPGAPLAFSPLVKAGIIRGKSMPAVASGTTKFYSKD